MVFQKEDIAKFYSNLTKIAFFYRFSTARFCKSRFRESRSRSRYPLADTQGQLVGARQSKYPTKISATKVFNN